MKTYAITGATGFVGEALARRLLSQGHRVIALVRDGEPPEGCHIVRGELEDFAACTRLINESLPDTVFHVAAQAMVGVAQRDPFGTFESNVRGTYNLLEATRRLNQFKPLDFVMASSDKAYGEMRVYADGTSPYEEDDPLEGRGPYDCSKSCADLIAQSYGRSYGMNVGIVRAGNIYGPGDTEQSRIVPSVMANIACGERPLILSDGTPLRNYLYIDDAVEGYLAVEKRNAGTRAYNLAGDETLSVKDLALRMCDILCAPWGRELDIVGIRKSGEIKSQELNTERARTELGWKPRVSLDDGIARTWMWYNGVKEET